MHYIPKALIIQTKTNLHVGSDSLHYDIVDKTIQRDSISELPVINASSLKGALRYHFTSINKLVDTQLEQIFGKEGDSQDKSKEGEVKFLDSYLLFLPLRSDKKPFYYVTSKATLKACVTFYETIFNIELKEVKDEIANLDDNTIFDENSADIEDYTCKKSVKSLQNFLTLLPIVIEEEEIAILSNSNFRDACKHLPIIARNKVATQNSIKDDSNLWYEEIVPRESIFYTANLDYANYTKRNENSAKYVFKKFYDGLQNELIQVGANASIGYGLCKFYEVTTPTTKKELTNAKTEN